MSGAYIPDTVSELKRRHEAMTLKIAFKFAVCITCTQHYSVSLIHVGWVDTASYHSNVMHRKCQ